MDATAHLVRLCPLCQCSNASSPPLPYSREPWVLKQCGQCGLVYLENPVDYSKLHEQFAWEKTHKEERLRRQQDRPIAYKTSKGLVRFRRRLVKRRKLQKLILEQSSKGNVIDVGCGKGKDFRILPEGFVPYGVEISKELAAESNEEAAKRGGYVIHGDALSGLAQFPDGFFSVATLSSVLEHEVNPGPLLQALRRVLCSGGRMIIKVPNFGSLNRRVRGRNWCGFRFPDHVNYFTPETLRRLIKESSFEVIRFGFFDHHPFSDNMWLVALKK